LRRPAGSAPHHASAGPAHALLGIAKGNALGSSLEGLMGVGRSLTAGSGGCSPRDSYMRPCPQYPPSWPGRRDLLGVAPRPPPRPSCAHRPPQRLSCHRPLRPRIAPWRRALAHARPRTSRIVGRVQGDAGFRTSQPPQARCKKAWRSSDLPDPHIAPFYPATGDGRAVAGIR
jgi:hypothetical protein